MLDRWLKAAGVDAESVGGQVPPEGRIFDASSWEPSDGAAKALGSGRPRRHSRSSVGTARVPRFVLFSVALIFACATALLVLSEESGASSPEHQEPADATPSQKPAWLPVIRPLRLFALEAPELIKAAPNYDAARSTLGDGREDNLSFGAAARGDASFMRISVYRPGSEAADPAPFFVDLSRRAASVGLAVAKATPGEPTQTKFGEMETAEVKLSMNDVERSCLAFRRAAKGENLRIAGWYCAPVGSFAGRASLACLVDRLALLSAGEDLALRDGFVAAEKRRPAACGKGPLLAATSAATPVLPQGKLRGTKPR